jgi:hypothetical protein
MNDDSTMPRLAAAVVTVSVVSVALSGCGVQTEAPAAASSGSARRHSFDLAVGDQDGEASIRYRPTVVKGANVAARIPNLNAFVDVLNAQAQESVADI